MRLYKQDSLAVSTNNTTNTKTPMTVHSFYHCMSCKNMNGTKLTHPFVRLQASALQQPEQIDWRGSVGLDVPPMGQFGATERASVSMYQHWEIPVEQMSLLLNTISSFGTAEMRQVCLLKRTIVVFCHQFTKTTKRNGFPHNHINILSCICFSFVGFA